MDQLSYSTLRVQQHGSTCSVQIYRPEAANAINRDLLVELAALFDRAEKAGISVVILEGLPEVFCFGADFGVIGQAAREGGDTALDPALMYDLFQRMAFGELLTVAHVRGKANAGGVGLVAACDLVIADLSAVFSLSELVFGLVPAIVLPFLMRRVGYQRAHYLASTTQAISVKQACEWGLVDAYDANSQALLRRHLLRMGRFSRRSVARYKAYAARLCPIDAETRRRALSTNLEVFRDPENVAAIARYAEHGLFPWEEPAREAAPQAAGSREHGEQHRGDEHG